MSVRASSNTTSLNHRGADDLRLADLLDPPRNAGHRRRAGEQLSRQDAQLAAVELRDRRQRNRGGRSSKVASRVTSGLPNSSAGSTSTASGNGSPGRGARKVPSRCDAHASAPSAESTSAADCAIIRATRTSSGTGPVGGS